MKSQQARVLRILTAVGLVAVAAAFSGCQTGAEATVEPGERLRIVATIAPAGALAAAVAGESADVSVLAGPGVDPHDFELSPGERQDLDDANLVVRIGLGADSFVDGAVSDSRLVTLSEGLHLRHAGEHSHDDGEEHSDWEEEEEWDPHVWHDPHNGKVMADALAAAFAEADPANADSYSENADALKQRLDAADAEIRSLIDSIPPEDRKMVTNHDAFGYFLDRYGLALVGTVFPTSSNTSEPSAGDIADLVETIQREHVKAVFSESSVNPAVASQLAEDAGVEVVDDLYGDSLGQPGSGADTVEGMLLSNARKIAAALR